MEKEVFATDGKLDDRQTWKSPTTKMTSVNILSELYELAKVNNITFKEAMEFGIKFLFADSQGFDYPECALQRKLEKVVAHRNSLINERNALREQTDLDEDKEQDTKKDINEIFDAKPSEEKKDE